MTPLEAPKAQPSGRGSGPHRLLPIAGVGAAAVAVLVHLGGGAVLMRLGGGAVPMPLGGGGVIFGGVALALGLAAIVALKLLLVVALGRAGLVGGAKVAVHSSRPGAGTTGKTIRAAHSYDRHVALLTLGRGRALRDRTVALARIAPGEHVLDVGCGTGEVAVRAKARTGPSGSVAGIDPSPEMIAVAVQKASQAGWEIDYRVAAVEALPFADATFDAVVSSLMMHHLPEDLKPRALAEVRRVLKPGGRLVVVDFQRPTSLPGRFAPVWLLHRSKAEHRLPELPSLLHAAGFAAVETLDTGTGYLGCIQARVAE